MDQSLSLLHFCSPENNSKIIIKKKKGSTQKLWNFYKRYKCVVRISEEKGISEIIMTQTLPKLISDTKS